MSKYKLLQFDKEARKSLSVGADLLAKAVISTLGPQSKNVGINQYPSPVIIHDGVKVARAIKLKDPFQDMGAGYLYEAAEKTNSESGDGTTTATLLGNTLFQEGLKLIDGVNEGLVSKKINAMDLRREIFVYSELIQELLLKKARPLEKDEWNKVANISAASPEIGKLIADAFEKVGKDGVVMVESGTSTKTNLTVQEGMEFDNGWLSQYFVTNPDKMIAEYQDGYVLLTDYTISDPMQLIPLVEKIIKENKPLLIIANDLVGPALHATVTQKLRLGTPIVAVMAPEYADIRKMMLDDLAVLTGGEVISSDLKHELREVEINQLGRFKNLKVTAGKTTITPLYPDSEEIKERAKVIKDQIDGEKDEFRKTRLLNRLGKLSGSVAVIEAGGSTETEINDMKERIDDAVHALKAALKEGIIAGGGVALRDIAVELKPIGDKQIFELIQKVLFSPSETIINNSGITGLEEYSYQEGEGVNVLTNENVNMIEAGILDPVSVTKSAVKYAFSAAAMMLTVEALISDDLEEDYKNEKN